MLGQNKKKIDSKVRWQNNRFKDRLRDQRNYKRPARKIPQTNWEIFLSKAGLGSWAARLITLTIFLFLVYLAFIPNIFYVKNIRINDSDPASLAAAQSLASSYLKKYTPWPQKNLLLLSKAGLKNYLLSGDQKVLSVDKISKSLPSTLIINITPRVNQFLVQTASSTYFILSNDGLVTDEVFADASGALPTYPFLISLTQSGSLSSGQSPVNPQELDFIRNLQAQLPGITKSSIDHYEIDDLQSSYFTAYLKSGWQAKFDFTSDLNQTLSRLSLLLSQLQPGDIKNLYYIDMRFAGRAYVCYQNTACQSPTIIPNGTATSTPSSTPDSVIN